MECRLRITAHSHIIQLLIVHRQGMHQSAPLAQDYCRCQRENAAMLKLQFPCHRCWEHQPQDLTTAYNRGDNLRFTIYDHMHIFIYIYILSGCPILWSIHVYLYTYNTLVLSCSLLIFNCLLGQLPSSWETLAEGCSHATWKGPVAHHAMYCASQLHVFSKNKTVEEGCLFSKEYCILHRFFQQVMYSLQ